MLKKLLKILFIVIGIILIVIILVASSILFINSPTNKINSGDVTFIIHKGENLIEIAKNLEEEAIIRSALLLRLISRILKTEKAFIAGYYEIKKGFSTVDIHKLLVSGSQVQIKITIPEGWTKSRIARHFAKNGISNIRELLEAINSEEILKKYNIYGDTLEGFLFPDTYFFNEALPASEVVDKMAANFFKNLKEIVPDYENMDNRELYEKVIMASIIEREYRIKYEAPIIASVFYNRLHARVGLESCATIEYIITELFGQAHPERITLKMKEIDSPYNTYKWHGLPPGPVSNPGIVALKAAFYPAKSDYWYFCVKDKNTGEHYFSKDLDEHNEAKWYYLKGYGKPPVQN